LLTTREKHRTAFSTSGADKFGGYAVGYASMQALACFYSRENDADAADLSSSRGPEIAAQSMEEPLPRKHSLVIDREGSR
jgi:hypothetical protein